MPSLGGYRYALPRTLESLAGGLTGLCPSDFYWIFFSFVSNYKYFSCQSSCLLLLLEVCQNDYGKENISVGGSEQRRAALFWIHLR